MQLQSFRLISSHSLQSTLEVIVCNDANNAKQTAFFPSTHPWMAFLPNWWAARTFLAAETRWAPAWTSSRMLAVTAYSRPSARETSPRSSWPSMSSPDERWGSWGSDTFTICLWRQSSQISWTILSFIHLILQHKNKQWLKFIYSFSERLLANKCSKL